MLVENYLKLLFKFVNNFNGSTNNRLNVFMRD